MKISQSTILFSVACCVLLLVSQSFAQIEEEDDSGTIYEFDIPLDNDPLTAEHEITDVHHEEEDKREQEIYDESQKERIRDLYVACIITARHKLSSYGQKLASLLQYSTSPEKSPLYQKILVEHILQCALYGSQNPNVSTDIIKSLTDKTFNVADWEVIFMSIDFERYNDPHYPTDTTADEKHILSFVEQFDEVMKKNRNDESEVVGNPKQAKNPSGGYNQDNDEDEDLLPGMARTQEPTIGAFSFSKLSFTYQMIYFFVIIFALFAAVYIAYQKVTLESAGPKIKNRKDKQKKKSS